MTTKRSLLNTLLERLTHAELTRLVAQAQKEPEETDWKKEVHTCPKCGHTGPVDPDFGTRLVRGRRLKQSYCASCRKSINYHARPRKNASTK